MGQGRSVHTWQTCFSVSNSNAYLILLVLQAVLSPRNLAFTGLPFNPVTLTV